MDKFFAWYGIFCFLLFGSMAIYWAEWPSPRLKKAWSYFLAAYALAVFAALNIYIVAN